MPGLAGIISLRSTEECTRIVSDMVATMRHRTDYVTGAISCAELGIHVGWLAHPGAFAARVSGQVPADGIDLAFAGECFPGLEGHPIDGNDIHASARWLLRQYRADPVAFPSSLNGPFSGVVVDRAARRALVFNDRYGCERLYVAEDGADLYFASEAKALLALLPNTRSFDDRGVADYICFGSCLNGRTLFRGVKLLAGATLLEVKPGGRRSLSRYFVPESWAAQEKLGQDEFESALRDVFPRILRPYVESSGRLGISITGGLDTRMIMACGVRPTTDAVCYTFGAMSGVTVDASIGARVAAIRGMPHVILRLAPEFLTHFRDHIDETVRVSDGCAGLTQAHEIPFNRAAREIADVRVTGNFGSEILRSMSTFKPIGFAGDLLERRFMDAVVEAARDAASWRGEPVAHSAFREIPWHLFGTLCAARSQVTVRTPYLDNDLVQLAFRAPSTSRSSPTASLRLVEHCDADLAHLPTDRGLGLGDNALIRLLRRTSAEVLFKLDYLYCDGLAGPGMVVEPLLRWLFQVGLLGRHKYLPYRVWLRQELAGFARETLAEVQSRPLPYWNLSGLATLVTDHINGRRNNLREINCVLTLEAVERLLLRPSATRPDQNSQLVSASR